MDAAVTTLKFESKAVIPTDPRTKLFLTVTVSTIMITGGTGGFMNLVRPCLMACPIVFLLLSRKWVAAARFAVTYAILFALELTVLPLLTGTWNFILGAAVGIYRVKKCLSPAKKYKLYKSSINKSLHFAQRRLSSSTRG